MEPFWIVMTVVIVLMALVTLVIVSRYRRRKRAERQAAEQQLREQPIREWLQKCEDTTGRDLVEVGAPPPGFDNFPGVLEMIVRQNQTRKRLEEQEKSRTLCNQAQSEPDMAKQAETLEQLNNLFYYLTKEQREWVEIQRATMTRSRAERLLAETRDGNRESFDELVELVVGGKYSSYHERCSQKYEFPADWDDLVVRHHENPDLDEFAFVNKDVKKGTLSLMTAEALRERSLRKAKIVRAFCMEDRRYREAVGEILFAELTKLVDALHAEQGIFSH